MSQITAKQYSPVVVYLDDAKNICSEPSCAKSTGHLTKPLKQLVPSQLLNI